MLAASVLIGAASCSGYSADETEAGEIAQAITAGTVDTSDPAIARLSGGLSVCSGTLISGTVILTAAHCLGPPAPTHADFSSTIAPDGEHIAIVASRVHPRFDPLRLDNDLAMVVLAYSPDIAPVPLWSGAADIVPGTPLRVIGFGRTTPDDPAMSTKRTGTARVSAMTDELITLTPSPSLPCTGDSGGPALVVAEGSEQLAAITSGGDEPCEVFTDSTRVDRYATSFIQPFLDEQAGEGGCSAGRDRPDRGVTGALVLAAFAILRRARRAKPRPRTSLTSLRHRLIRNAQVNPARASTIVARGSR